MIYVNSITIRPQNVSVKEGKWYNDVSVEICPTNATNKALNWYSNSPEIASVNANGEICGVSVGTAVIYASADDGSGVVGSCTVTVEAPTKVTYVSIGIDEKTVGVGARFQLSATAYPENADNRAIRWGSSNTSVASVDYYSGCVTTKAPGTAVIRATAADGSGKYDTCSIIVVSEEGQGNNNADVDDPREKVVVEKDSHSFYVKFADGKIWNNIGIDLSLSENHSGYPMWNPDSYTSLNVEERRFIYNYENNYSEKQFALLYLLDPLGVEYYLSRYDTTKYATQFDEEFQDYNDKLRAYLKFKDRIYKEIFGRSPIPFVLSNDGRRVNVTWSYDRVDVFTDSELIFGAHNIVDMIDLLECAVDLIIHLVDSILPDTTKNKWIMLGVNVAKTLLFSGSIVEAFSDAASDFLDDYIEDSSNGEITIMEWPNPLLDNIYKFKTGIHEILTLPNIHDIQICDKVNKQNNYNVVFSNGTFEMFVGEIIELCS